jgi:hypothetical protein
MHLIFFCQKSKQSAGTGITYNTEKKETKTKTKTKKGLQFKISWPYNKKKKHTRRSKKTIDSNRYCAADVIYICVCVWVVKRGFPRCKKSKKKGFDDGHQESLICNSASSFLIPSSPSIFLN